MLLPALPRRIFDTGLYNRLLHLWFEGHPPNITGPNSVVLSRWFSANSTPETKAKFDDRCRQVAGQALTLLSPEQYPLPAWQGYEKDRKEAGTLSAPFRALISESGVSQRENSPSDTLTYGAIACSLFLLLDQMPRNIFRSLEEQWRIYNHYDRLARALAYSIIDDISEYAQMNAQLRYNEFDPFVSNPSRRLWFYMPLAHSELVADHDTLNRLLIQLESRSKDSDDEAGASFVRTSIEAEKEHRDILEKFGRYCYRNEMLGRETTKEEREWLNASGQTFGTK